MLSSSTTLLNAGTLAIIFIVEYSCGVVNNVCPTYQDYYTIESNPRCWYNFAAEANATDIIKYHGYPLEVHKVTTEDGYILTLFRIPPGANLDLRKGPVFIHPALLYSAASYLAIGKESLAFLLSDAGYDVWLGNYRGTEYSEGHVNLTVYNREYWDHSLDEIGQFDVPAVIEHIAEETGERGNIVYIGYSLGSIVGMIYGSEYPEKAKANIKLFVLLGPAALLNNIVSPFKIAAALASPILKIIKNTDLIRLASHASAQRALMQQVCLESPKLMEICVQILNLFIGIPGQTDVETFPVFFNQFPAGSSFKIIKQIADSILGPFAKFDYGFKNSQKYKARNPPMYNITKIEIPIYMMYALNDWLATKKDALTLFGMLSPVGKSYGIQEIDVRDFNHADFLFGRNVKSIVYDNILRLLYNVDNKNVLK